MAEFRHTDDASPASAPADPSDRAGRLGPLSRRKKIAIVLFLVLSGYALTDDTPVPPAPTSVASAPISADPDADMERLLGSIDSPIHEQPGAARSHQNAATFLAARESDMAGHHHRHQESRHDHHGHSGHTAKAADSPTTGQSLPEPTNHSALMASDAPPARSPRLRFTGRIDPLY